MYMINQFIVNVVIISILYHHVRFVLIKKRDEKIVCVVADIGDLCSIERANFFSGGYHVLDGKLSAIDGGFPNDLEIEKLRVRIITDQVHEVIVAMSADLDGHTTLFFVHGSCNIVFYS